jgi:hypothetical protein
MGRLSSWRVDTAAFSMLLRIDRKCGVVIR